MGLFDGISNWIADQIMPAPVKTPEVVNPDYLLAISGAKPPPPTATDQYLWSIMKPGEVVISGQFAGQPTIDAAKVVTGSTLNQIVTGQAPVPKELAIYTYGGVGAEIASTPDWWKTGQGAPTNTDQLAAAVAPYNAPLGQQIKESGEQANLIPNLLAGTSTIGLLILGVLVFSTLGGKK